MCAMSMNGWLHLRLDSMKSLPVFLGKRSSPHSPISHSPSRWNAVISALCGVYDVLIIIPTTPAFWNERTNERYWVIVIQATASENWYMLNFPVHTWTDWLFPLLLLFLPMAKKISLWSQKNHVTVTYHDQDEIIIQQISGQAYSRTIIWSDRIRSDQIRNMLGTCCIA